MSLLVAVLLLFATALLVSFTSCVILLSSAVRGVVILQVFFPGLRCQVRGTVRLRVTLTHGQWINIIAISIIVIIVSNVTGYSWIKFCRQYTTMKNTKHDWNSKLSLIFLLAPQKF